MWQHLRHPAPWIDLLLAWCGERWFWGGGPGEDFLLL